MLDLEEEVPQLTSLEASNISEADCDKLLGTELVVGTEIVGDFTFIQVQQGKFMIYFSLIDKLT
jgi:hypothetical protein